MTDKTEKEHADRLREALAARDALASALTAVGIQLPAMDVRRAWAGEAPYALVHLGVCSAPVAHALAEALGRGAAR
ncbi:hypothetical protein [Streptomyces sp. SID11385]|uniref:hypothetical protein n=1 Tax=Streptomyces sp. SID11385 TaxID=2706031 RepID=UPI0013CB3271|nr:hypothetical protein [Streptomyces sp. SID11385]NEA40088.1 hypothetical protein [Streptomyces sp. SID11385]